MSDCGIVTSVSENLWESYLLFHTSLMRSNKYRLAVVNLGLPAHLVNFIKQQERTVLLDVNIQSLDSIDDDWRKWYKPFFFREGMRITGFAQALWLDIDTIVTGPLDELFAHVDRGFLVIPDYFAPEYCPNNRELYDVLMLQRPTDSRVINSGVVGANYTRDALILEQWFDNVKMAHAHQEIKDLITLHDQGALLLAIHQIGHFGNIIENSKWNFPARRLFYGTDHDLIDRVATDHPEAAIVHYMGWPKLPQLMTVNEDEVVKANKLKFGDFETTNIIVSGFDELLSPATQALRQQSIYGGWCHYDRNPMLAKQSSELYYGGRPVPLYTPRIDWPFSYTMSEYLGPLFPCLGPKLGHLVLVGDPVEHIISKLLTFQIWPRFLHLFPDFYQLDYNLVADHELTFKNQFRLAIGDTLIDLCLNEMIWMLGQSLTTGTAVFAKSISDAVEKLAIIGPWRMFTTNRTMVALSYPEHSSQTKKWVLDFVGGFRDKLVSTFYKILYKHKAKIPMIIL